MELWAVKILVDPLLQLRLCGHNEDEIQSLWNMILKFSILNSIGH